MTAPEKARRRPDLATRNHVLYRMFAGDGRLLYVGITADVGMRLHAHAGDQPWWREVATITVEHFDDRATALTAETTAILTERPAHNVQHNRPDMRSCTIGFSDALWVPLEAAAKVHGHDRSGLIRQFAQWYLSAPGAQLPARPEPGSYPMPVTESESRRGSDA